MHLGIRGRSTLAPHRGTATPQNVGQGENSKSRLGGPMLQTVERGTMGSDRKDWYSTDPRARTTGVKSQLSY